MREGWRKKGVNKKHLELVKKIQKGDKNALEELCIFETEYLTRRAEKFVEMCSDCLETDDILQDFYIGLIEAASKYKGDSNNGATTFTNYAAFYYDAEAKADVIKNQAIYFPANIFYDVRNPERVKNVPDYRIKILKELHDTMFNLYDGTDKINLMKKVKEILFEETGYSHVEFDLIRKKLMNIINEKLTERERNIIFARFGFNNENVQYTLEETSKVLGLGVTRDRIRQIEAKAIRKLMRSCREFKNGGENNMAIYREGFSEPNPTPTRLKINHIGEHKDGYTIVEQYPYGCLAVSDVNKYCTNIKTRRGRDMTIGYVDRKFIPLCELEQFA